jgi:hypothetical protein
MTSLPHHRKNERIELKARIAAGANVLMLAPRRIGKTWLMDKVADDMKADGWLCIKIDVEGMRTENEFLRALCQEIEKTQALTDRVKSHFLQRFKQLTTHVQDGNLAAAIGDIDPREFLETLVSSLNAEEKQTLILIDEIALFIHEQAKDNPDSARSLLYHLRKLQQTYPKVRWFLTGSVGLDVIARRHNMLGALLGIDSYPLEPFSREAAHSYLDELCATGQISQPFKLDEDSFDYLAKELGWLSPYYLRQIALQMKPTNQATSGLPVATAADVENAFERLLSPTQRLHFAAWEEHIDKNFGDVDTLRLRAILDIACEQTNGEIEATLLTRLTATGETPNQNALRTLLQSLETDGFLHRIDNRWCFRSGLLRRYWKEYMGNG